MHLSGSPSEECWEKWCALKRTECIKAYWVYCISDELENIGVSPNIAVFLNERKQQAKAEVKEKQAMSSVYTYWTSDTTFKNVVQEWNPIEFSLLNKQNWDSLYSIS